MARQSRRKWWGGAEGEQDDMQSIFSSANLNEIRSDLTNDLLPEEKCLADASGYDENPTKRHRLDPATKNSQGKRA